MQKGPVIRNQVRKSLRYSMMDGISASAMVGLSEQYVGPYAIAMNANNTQIGLLSSVPSLISSLFQSKAADLVSKQGSRKKVLTTSVFFNGLMWLPILLIPFLFKGDNIRVNLMIVLFSIYALLGSLGAPAAGSLVADYLHERMRGRYLGWRGGIFGIIATVFSFIAGFILHMFTNKIFIGFSIIFGLAMVARLFSWYFLTKLYEPPLAIKREHYFTFWEFIKRYKESNFAKFVVYVSCITFSANLIGPFGAVYMLRELKFSYLEYTIVTIPVTIVSILTMRYWGRQADRVGNIRILAISSLIVPFLPILWLISRNIVFLVIVNVIGGYAWAGFNLCAGNFILDSAIPEKRARCVAYFNIINGTALCIGALSGSFFSTRLPLISGSRILTLFLVSGLVRALFVIILLPRIREVRKVQKVSTRNLVFSVTGIKPVLDTARYMVRMFKE